MHGGAPGSGAPFGRRNGNYRHGYFTAEAKQQRLQFNSRAMRRRGCCSSGAGVTDDQFRNLLLFSMATFVILFITGWIMTKIWRRRLKRDEVPKDVTSAELKTSVDALRKIEQAIRRDFMDRANERKSAEKGE
jgi:hypothetical protein